jgi:hypothetical protein
MPLQFLLVGVELRILWEVERLTVKAPIFITVVELGSKSITYNCPHVLVESEIPRVKDGMNVST